jgi:hypothetical protein
MFARHYCRGHAKAEAAAPGSLPPWSSKRWYYDCGVPVPVGGRGVARSIRFAAEGVEFLEPVLTAVACGVLASVVSFPPGHNADTAADAFAAALQARASPARFTTVMYNRAAVTVGYFALLHEGDSGLFAAKLRMFVVSCSSPLLVIEPLVIVECRHGYVTVDVTQTQPLRALPWSVGLCVTHCAAVEHAPGTLSLMPADCLPVFLFDKAHTSAAAAHHAAGTVPSSSPTT